MPHDPIPNLRDHRLGHDFTLEAVANHLHCAESHIEAIESDTTTPTTAEISILADLYAVPIATITAAVDATRQARRRRRKRKGGRLEIIEHMGGRA